MVRALDPILRTANHAEQPQLLQTSEGLASCQQLPGTSVLPSSMGETCHGCSVRSTWKPLCQLPTPRLCILTSPPHPQPCLQHHLFLAWLSCPDVFVHGFYAWLLGSDNKILLDSVDSPLSLRTTHPPTLPKPWEVLLLTELQLGSPSSVLPSEQGPKSSTVSM